ncbi:MAG: carbohydrate ABC transporter permease [Clostridia bacterium]|nr:carbohydrate ABC transporter permease [Clostridia bacterium]
MKIKHSFGERLFDVINNIIMLLVAFVMIYPLYYVVVASFSNASEFVSHKGMLWSPLSPNILAYQLAFKNPMLLRGYANTIFIVVVGVLVNLILTVIGAYFLSRKEVKLQKPIMILIIITMFFSGGMIPFYFSVRDLGLENTHWALIFPAAINTFNLIIMKTAFLGVPESLTESANLDGAGHIRILLNIVLPVTKSSLAVIGLYYAVEHWSSWFNAMLFLKDREKYPLQLILREILIQNNMTEMADGGDVAGRAFISETIKYAIIVISTAPILCVYPFLQKYFTKGVMIGAVKG